MSYAIKLVDKSLHWEDRGMDVSRLGGHHLMTDPFPPPPSLPSSSPPPPSLPSSSLPSSSLPSSSPPLLLPSPPLPPPLPLLPLPPLPPPPPPLSYLEPNGSRRLPCSGCAGEGGCGEEYHHVTASRHQNWSNQVSHPLCGPYLHPLCVLYLHPM